MFTARYRLIPYVKQITFRFLKVNIKWQYDAQNTLPFSDLLLFKVLIEVGYVKCGIMTEDTHIHRHFFQILKKVTVL